MVGWETPKGSLVGSKFFFLPEMLSADLITGCGNSDMGSGRQGKTHVQAIDRGCNSLTQGHGASKQKRRSWHLGSTPDSGLSHRCVCKYSVTEEPSKSLAIS